MTDSKLNSNRTTENVILLAATILATAAVWMFQWWYVPVGDDLTYIDFWHPGGQVKFHGFAIHHWLSVNGRLANILAPLVLALPKWLSVSFVAICYGMLLWLVMRIATLESGNSFGAKALAFFLIVITLPWADALMLYDCHMNYTLTAVLTLLWLLMLKKRADRWALIIIGFAAGAMHEGCSVGVCVGLAVWLTTSKLWKDKSLMPGVIAYGLGTVMCLLSPGMLYRIGSNEAFTRWWAVCLTSDYYVVILLILLANILIFNTLRYNLRQLAKTEWVVYAIAAGVCAGISSFSGIVGRSGFFAQIFALIALIRLATYFGFKVRRGVAGVGGSLLITAALAQLGYTAYWQKIVGTELSSVISQITTRRTTVAYTDYHALAEVPLLTLGKTRGVPEPHESWVRTTLQEHYGLPDKPVVLPAALRGVNLASLHTPLKFGNVIISPYEPMTQKATLFEGLDIATFNGYVNVINKTNDVSPATLQADSRGSRYSVTPVEVSGRAIYLIAPYGYDVFQDLR